MSVRRGAVVGLGAIARNGHLPRWRLRGDAQIVAACDITYAGPSGGVDRASGLPCYGSVQELLERQSLDFVDVCTPPSSHAAAAEAALARGIDVLCEKPLVVRRADLARLRAQAVRSERVLFTVHNWQHAPILAAATRWVAEKRVGRVQEVTWDVERTGPSATVQEEGNWRLDPAVAGGGILVDHGWHALYVVLGWMGRMPERASARLERKRYADLPVEDTASVRYEGEDLVATLTFTWASERRANAARIVGTEGEIRMLDDRLVLGRHDGTHHEAAFPAALSAGSAHPEWFDATVDDFLDEIEGRRPRGANLEVASRCFGLLEAAWRSAADGGRPVAVTGLA